MSTVTGMNNASQILQCFGAAPTLMPTQRLSVRSFGLGQPAEHEEAANGSRLYRRDPVFKAGTFKDSWGQQNTWETTHLTQMVFNFGLLRSAGKLVSVPWRDGHPSIFGGGGNVIGWIAELSVEDDVLYADWLCTEPEAAAKYERGTFGPRSAEVGYYESNDEAMYWPVFMGCAFVDIPAVEGLFSKEQAMDQLQAFSVLPDTEIDRRVVLFNSQQSAQGGEGNGGEGGAGDGATPAPAQPDPHPVGGNPAGEQPPASGGDGGGEGSGQHRTPPSFQFTVNGQQTSDFAAVQAHITSLETALNEQARAHREEFVNGLASRNVIPATQLDQFLTHVHSLTPDQYQAFEGLYSGAGPAPLLAPHAAGVTNPSGEQPQEMDELETARQVIAQHKRAGLKPDKIRETPSYKRLVAANQAPAL